MNGEKEYNDDRVGVEGAPIGVYGYHSHPHHPHHTHSYHEHHPHHPHTHTYHEHRPHYHSDYWRPNVVDSTGTPVTVQMPTQNMAMHVPSHPLTVDVPSSQQPMFIKQAPTVIPIQQPQYYQPYHHHRWNTGFGGETIAMPTALTAYSNENVRVRQHRGTRRLINPFYWIIRVMDHGRRNHCIRRGNLPGSVCAKVVATVPVAPQVPAQKQIAYTTGYEVAPQYVPMAYARVTQGTNNNRAIAW